ncbi:MAG: hypothetical protein HQ559_10395 [Lentisphaerae bacterium]|nr:hypothetical protein [Lentisphaerota bacterium]
MRRHPVRRWCLSLLACTACTARADSLLLKNGEERGHVAAITADHVVLADERRFPFEELVRVTFERSAVVAQPGAIVLNDGSVLSGALHELGTEQVRFRSTSLGPLTWPVTNVAAISFARDFSVKDMKVPPTGRILAVLKSGEVQNGELFAGSRSRVILRNEGALQNVPISDLLYIAMREADPDQRIVLRNGDCLNMPVTWKTNAFSVSTGTNSVRTIPIEAIKEIRFLRHTSNERQKE